MKLFFSFIVIIFSFSNETKHIYEPQLEIIRRFFEIQARMIKGEATDEEIAWLRKKVEDAEFLKKLQNKISDCKFDIFGMNNSQPIWGDDFLNNIKNYKMGLNLSRGKPIKYYSSDRLAQIMGNGLLTFIDKNTLLNRIIDKDCAVFYKNIDDLANKIIYFKNNPIKLKKIASKGKRFYTKNFNSKLVCSYIINKTFKINNKTNFIWD